MPDGWTKPAAVSLEGALIVQTVAAEVRARTCPPWLWRSYARCRRLADGGHHDAHARELRLLGQLLRAWWAIQDARRSSAFLRLLFAERAQVGEPRVYVPLHDSRHREGA